MPVDFVDLHAHSMYSILDGHPTPEEMVTKAVELGRSALALTDHGSISGHVMFEKAVAGFKQMTIGSSTMFIRDGATADLKPIYGMEAYATADVTVRDETARRKNHISLIAKNPAGYKNLITLTTRSWREGYYYRQTIDGEMLLDAHEGLIVLSGCESGSFMRRIEAEDWDGAMRAATNLKAAFGDDFYVEIQHYPHTQAKRRAAWQIAERLGIKTVMTCDTHYLEPDGWRFQQFLWSIREAKPVDDFKIEHAYMWEPDRLLAFVEADDPDMPWRRIFENTAEVAAKCEAYQLPRAPHVRFPYAGDKLEYIRETVTRFLVERGLWDDPLYRARMERELEAIHGKEYEDYFLVVADMIQWAKSAGIFVGPARGSAAGSLVCWGLRITEIDPVKYGLLFERFVDPTRVDVPDIDCDFEDDRRAEVTAYMERRYGAACVAGITTFARLGGKSALDDAARSYRIPKADVEIIKRHLVERSSGDQRASFTIEDTLEEFPEARAVYERYPALKIAAGVEGRIRHTGKHAAGLVVTSEPLQGYTAIIGREDARVIAVDWRDAAYLNLMKIDCLGLKELSLLKLMCERIGWTADDIYALPVDDPATFAAFNAHNYLGIFQFSGLAAKGVASRIQFESLEQIGDVNALSRPGPLHSGATEAYQRGHKSGEYAPILPQDAVRPIIAPTHGQIIYQEQVMRILREIGDMTWQDVCDIRNIMGKTKGSEAFDRYWGAWSAGCERRGVAPGDAKQIWETIRLYGKHSFNKAHALAYGLLTYWGMYMRVHFPREFFWAQLVKANDRILTGRFIMDARRAGLEFGALTLDAASSTWYIAQDGRICPGWGEIVGVGEKGAAAILEAAPFDNLDDMRERVSKRALNSKAFAAVEAKLGATVDDLYELGVWGDVDALLPERVAIADFLVDEYWAQRPIIVGRVKRINHKNRAEESRTRGDAEKAEQLLASGKPLDYAIVMLEDETDSVMVYIPPELYTQVKKPIWDAGEGAFMAALGSKNPAIQMMGAQAVEMLNIGLPVTPARARAFKDTERIAQ